MTNFTGIAGRLNRYIGTATADSFRFAAADLDGDTLSGRGGLDLLHITTAGFIAPTALANVSGIESIVLAPGGNSIFLSNANFADVTGARITVFGGSGGDYVDASGLSAANSVDFRSGGGVDNLRGGAGADVFRFSAADLNGDILIGGGGADQLVMRSAGTLDSDALNNMSGIETIVLAAGANGITIRDGNLLNVAGGRITVFGSSGDDAIYASSLGSANSVVINSQGGFDVLQGGGGNDLFRFKAADLSGDMVNGGSGVDTLQVSTAGTLTAAALQFVWGIEIIALAAGTNSLTLGNLNVGSGLAAWHLTVRGNSGADTIDGSALTNTSTGVLFDSGGGLDVLKGGAAGDIFRFTANNLSGDTLTGGAEIDQLLVVAAGEVTAGELAQMSGVEIIRLYVGGTSVALSDANFAGVAGGVITVTGSAGADTVDGSALGAANSLSITAGAGDDTLMGGAGADTFQFSGTGLATGDAVDGGDGIDVISFDADTTLLGDTISNVEELRYTGTGDAAITISGLNAAGFTSFGTQNFDGFTQVYTVELAAGTIADLSQITFGTRDAGDAIRVTSISGDTAVTLGATISSFTGGTGSDTVRGIYRVDAQINGGDGADWIDFDHTSLGLKLDGGAGNDTLVLRDGLTRYIDLSLANQIEYSEAEVIEAEFDINKAVNFENVDGSATTNGIAVWGSNTAASVLAGGSGLDSLTTGSGGGILIGGLGADYTAGLGALNRFLINSTEEADGDAIGGVVGTNVIELLGTTDLRRTDMFSIDKLVLAAGTWTGSSVSYSETDLGAAIYSEALQGFGSLCGNGAFAGTVESLAVYMDTSATLDLSSLTLEDWGAEDLLALVGNSQDNTIIGSSAGDTIFGMDGLDQLTGNGGTDTFAWSSALEGGDTLLDFIQGTDKLGFDADAFSVTGGVFDTTVTGDASVPTNDLSTADLLFVPITANTAEEVLDYVTNFTATPGTDGLFVVANSEFGNNVLYYSSNPWSAGPDQAFHLIADLGTEPVTTAIINDFMFI
jgi:hypothetical protein